MKFLTQRQKTFLIQKNIKINRICRIPSFGFSVYSTPTYSGGEKLDLNPFTKSLSHEMFIVKDKKNGFYRVNFHGKPAPVDFYVTEDELSYRGLLEISVLFFVLFVPFYLYNLFNGGVDKIEANLNK